MRNEAAAYMETHPDEFIPFLPSIDGEDGQAAGDAGLISPADFAKYIDNVKNSSRWGGQPEITALSCAFNIPIYIVQTGSPTIVVTDPKGAGAVSDAKHRVHISYHRNMYGLGEVSHLYSVSSSIQLRDSFSIIIPCDRNLSLSS
jgi:OTU domain-containing protein 6